MSSVEQVKDFGRVVGNGAHQLLNNFRSRCDGVVSSLTLADEAGDFSSVRALQRNSFLARLLSTITGLVVTLGISYYGVQWLMRAMDPTKHEKQEEKKKAEKLMKSIGICNTNLTDYELCIASNLVDPLSMVTEWEDIGGLTETIQEIQETIILPFRHRKLFAGSGLVQPPKGVLLYGPPGCGKTLVAKATAKAADARFINLQVSSLVDKWYGESQKRAEAVFSLACKLQPTIIFIDEIDSFLRARASSDNETTALMKTQFMSFWDGLLTDPNCWIIIIGATNRPNDVDAAILRRMPTRFHIGLPNVDQRRHILDIIMKQERVDSSVDLDMIARKTEGLSGSDLRELCRSAALCRVRELMNIIQHDGNMETFDSESLRPINSSDFDVAWQKMRPGGKYATSAVGFSLD